MEQLLKEFGRLKLAESFDWIRYNTHISWNMSRKSMKFSQIHSNSVAPGTPPLVRRSPWENTPESLVLQMHGPVPRQNHRRTQLQPHPNGNDISSEFPEMWVKETWFACPHIQTIRTNMKRLWTNTEMTSYRAVQQRVQISAVNTKNPDWSIMMQNSNMPSSVNKCEEMWTACRWNHRLCWENKGSKGRAQHSMRYQDHEIG